jgi:2,3,4,5-tetrahydropyridine-2-carboxylate N-succinyltransferase
MTHPLEAAIDALWENRSELSPQSPIDTIAAINQVVGMLDTGALRVAEKINGDWVTHQWIKKAVLLSFRVRDNRVQQAGDIRFFDKVDTKMTLVKSFSVHLWRWHTKRVNLRLLLRDLQKNVVSL